MLAAALLAARSCGEGDKELNTEEAIAIARTVAAFEPDETQARCLRQGLSAGIFCFVSMIQGTRDSPTRVQVVQIDAETGEIVDDGL